MKHITVETIVTRPLETVWKAWTTPEHIMVWNHASSDWECPYAENDLRVGGKFLARMSAKDGSTDFDFTGTYTNVIPHTEIAYVMDDGRDVTITFSSEADGVRVRETFMPETENSEALQRSGWQAILDNFKVHCESL